MNLMARSLAAPRRSGEKSLASIDEDTSIASTMSIPSESTFSILEEDLGRASARMMRLRAAVRRMKGICLIHARAPPFPFFQGMRDGTLRWGLLSLSSR